MYCVKCGNENKEGDLFCSKCGNKFDEVTDKHEIVDKKEEAVKRIASYSKMIFGIERKLYPRVILIIIMWAIIGIGTIASLFYGKSNNLEMANGNTQGNIKSAGIATIQGDWIYYNKYNTNTKKDCIYKIKNDGSEKKK